MEESSQNKNYSTTHQGVLANICKAFSLEKSPNFVPRQKEQLLSKEGYFC